MFLSEFNVVTEPDLTFNYWVGEDTAASWVKDALQTSERTSWISALGWINVYDTPLFHDGSFGEQRVTGSGLFFSGGKPKPDETDWSRYG